MRNKKQEISPVFLSYRTDFKMYFLIYNSIYPIITDTNIVNKAAHIANKNF